MAVPVTIVDKNGAPVTVVSVGGQPVDFGDFVTKDSVGQPNGPAGNLDGSGKIPVEQLPPLTHDVGEAATEAAMLALPVVAPAMALRTDFSPPHVFFLTADPATTLSNWHDTGEFGAGGGNPTATVGLAAKNGVANSFMRSDGAPAIDQTIAPTWTGAHVFGGVSTAANSSLTVRSTTPRLEFSRPDQPDRLKFEYESSETLRATYTNAAGDPVLSPFLINPAVVSVVECFFKAENESSATESTATVVANAPQFDIQKENGAADAKRWLIDGSSANSLHFKAVNDAGTTSNDYLAAARSGANVTSVTFGNGTSNPAYLWAGTGPWTVAGSTGTAGQVLTSTGNATAPAWTTHMPVVVSQSSRDAQSANVNVANFYTVPASGLYRVSSFLVIEAAATTSATLPSVNVAYTEAQTGSAVQDIITTSATMNQVGAHTGGSVVIAALQGTGLTYSTSNYASSGTNPMRYRVNIVVERLS